ncbi:hypothetical protein [Microlunatus elymi]|uniref:hypothetical protein n=1 Tax=Microlunatus elymi TaxID=2596828 RepID=UPI001D197638|nr:hypothetical protein [Microlunatus elymi]
MITKIRAAYVIGYADADHCILPDAELVHDDDRIIHVGGDTRVTSTRSSTPATRSSARASST